MKKTIYPFSLLLLSLGCEDTTRARLSAIGESAAITCWSSNEIGCQGKATGKVFSPAQGDGYLFKDAATKQLTEVSGNCVVRYGDTDLEETP